LSDVIVARSRPWATMPPSRMSNAWVKPGDLLDVVGDQGDRRGVRVGGQVGQAADEVLAGAQVEAGRGLVEQQQLGVGHEGAGDLDALALALGQRAVEAVGHPSHAELAQQRGGRASSTAS
jgi:hypothetical protein